MESSGNIIMLVELLFRGSSLFNGAGEICDDSGSYESTKRRAKDARGYYHTSEFRDLK
jgi:hypothetical protein